MLFKILIWNNSNNLTLVNIDIFKSYSTAPKKTLKSDLCLKLNWDNWKLSLEFIDILNKILKPKPNSTYNFSLGIIHKKKHSWQNVLFFMKQVFLKNVDKYLVTLKNSQPPLIFYNCYFKCLFFYETLGFNYTYDFILKHKTFLNNKYLSFNLYTAPVATPYTLITLKRVNLNELIDHLMKYNSDKFIYQWFYIEIFTFEINVDVLNWLNAIKRRR